MEEDETLSNPFYEAGIIKQRHKKRKWVITIFHEHKCKKKKPKKPECSKILKSSDSTAKSYKCKTDLTQHLKINQCNSRYKLKKNHAVISIDAQKVCHKSSHPFMIKKYIRKLRIEEAFLNLMGNKSQDRNPDSCHWTYCWKIDGFSLILG